LQDEIRDFTIVEQYNAL